MSTEPIDDLLDASRDVAFIGVGLGVLAFQKLQVQRRSLQRAFDTAPSSTCLSMRDQLRALLDHRR